MFKIYSFPNLFTVRKKKELLEVNKSLSWTYGYKNPKQIEDRHGDVFITDEAGELKML